MPISHLLKDRTSHGYPFRGTKIKSCLLSPHQHKRTRFVRFLGKLSLQVLNVESSKIQSCLKEKGFVRLDTKTHQLTISPVY